MPKYKYNCHFIYYSYPTIYTKANYLKGHCLFTLLINHKPFSIKSIHITLLVKSINTIVYNFFLPTPHFYSIVLLKISVYSYYFQSLYYFRIAYSNKSIVQSTNLQSIYHFILSQFTPTYSLFKFISRHFINNHRPITFISIFYL